MINKEIYKIWAPFGKKWVDWVRPVPFVAIDKNVKRFYPTDMVLTCLSPIDNSDKSTAIIVDLPGEQSVEAGILLAQKYGYRPIPIYNGVIEQNGARATSDNRSIINALVWGTSILLDIDLKDDAPPVFLTDTNRFQRHRVDGSIFDNSWDVYHQDLPSEEYFLKNGISKILVISNNLSEDLKKIFAEYTHKKIQIFISDGYDEPKLIKIRKKVIPFDYF